MKKTTFAVQQMDCASEEQLVRLKLQEVSNISSLQFDLPNRKLGVFHTGDYQLIFESLNSLQLDTTLIESGATDEFVPTGKDNLERKLLWQVLSINFFFFALEILMGFISNSMGLVAETYLFIPAGREGFGKIHIKVQGSLHALQAITDDAEKIPTGKLVKVVGIVNDSVLLVTSNLS